MSTNVSKKLVQIKKVLPTVLTEDRADNYLKGLNFVYLGAQDIYEKSLSALMNGETENCLKFMIFGLDVDRTYTPLLNLCRTMLFGMSDILKNSDYYLYKQKYKDLKEAKISLMKKVNDLHNKKLPQWTADAWHLERTDPAGWGTGRQEIKDLRKLLGDMKARLDDLPPVAPVVAVVVPPVALAGKTDGHRPA